MGKFNFLVGATSAFLLFAFGATQMLQQLIIRILSVARMAVRSILIRIRIVLSAGGVGTVGCFYTLPEGGSTDSIEVTTGSTNNFNGSIDGVLGA